jgi:hypothetical protein
VGTGIAAHPLSGFDVSITGARAGPGAGAGAGSGSEMEAAAEERAAGTGAGAGAGSGTGTGTGPGLGVDDITLAERGAERGAAGAAGATGAEDVWVAAAGSWRFLLLRPRRGDTLLTSLCVWQGLPLVYLSPHPEPFLSLTPPNVSHMKCLRKAERFSVTLTPKP